MEWHDSATDTVQAFIQNGLLYFGTDTTTAPAIGKSGSSLQATVNAALTGMRLSALILGTGNVKVITGSGSPNGAFTADPGGLYLNTSGGSGASLWVKESGVGTNTGWVKAGTPKAPTTVTTATYSQASNDASLFFNGTATQTVTLVDPTTVPGQMLHVKNIAAFAVNSASANVVPIAGGAASTSILAATAGKWATLQSDGTNWVVIASN
jgi:hypothetical protein